MKWTPEKLEELVSDTIKETVGIDFEITHNLSLIDGGILDSMSIVSIVQTLQRELDISFEFADITLENFDSIEVMVPFLHQLLEE